MAKKTIDQESFLGKKFGRLTVFSAEKYESKRGTWQWYLVCACECGGIALSRSSNVRNGFTFSCGCLVSEMASELTRKTHGLSRSPEYKSWVSMKARCQNKKVSSHTRYGGRGISVCRRWQNFENFINDMGRRPTASHTVDRIDNNGNYEPGNCRWATPKQQARNKRNTPYFKINGHTKSLSEWCEVYGINYTTVRARLGQGRNIKGALQDELAQGKSARVK